MEFVIPKKTTVDRGSAEVESGFSPLTISSQAIFKLCYAECKYTYNSSSTFRLVLKQLMVDRIQYIKILRIYGEQYAHQFCVVKTFLEYHPPGSFIPRCQIPSLTREWFYEWVGDIDFYKMFPSQSESTIFHESIKYVFSMFDSIIM